MNAAVASLAPSNAAAPGQPPTLAAIAPSGEAFAERVPADTEGAAALPVAPFAALLATPSTPLKDMPECTGTETDVDVVDEADAGAVQPEGLWLPVAALSSHPLMDLPWRSAAVAVSLPPRADLDTHAAVQAGLAARAVEVADRSALPAGALQTLPPTQPEALEALHAKLPATQIDVPVGVDAAGGARDAAPAGVDLVSAPAKGNTSVALSVESGKAAASGTSAHSTPPLMQVLAQRMQMQRLQGVDTVTVRLDPPQWGTLEIRIQQDAGGMQVHLQASHAEVGRQLAALADGLRQELQWRTPGDAAVTVGTGRAMGGQQGQQQPSSQEEPETAVIGQSLQWDESLFA